MEPIPSLAIPPTKSLHELLRFDPQVTQMPYKRTVACPPLSISHTSCSLSLTAERSFSRFPPVQLRKGSEVLVEALKREGVKDVFTGTGDESMEIIQEALLTCPEAPDIIRNHKGGIFAADGYARSSGLPGVYFASSGATDLISGITDARLDSVPIVAITGQETPVVEAARSLSKKNYLVLDVQDIPRTVREAFFVASSGRPGPVLIHVPEDLRQKFGVLSWGQSMGLPRYMARLLQEPQEAHLEPIIRLVWESKKPVLFAGDGCWDSSEELKKFVELTGIPVASNLMGLGAYPVAEDNDLSLGMVGMHGSVYANDAVDRSDLLLAFGVKSDDRVTGKLETFSSRATIVHIDIDSAEIGKTKHPHVSVCVDVKFALKGLNKILEGKIGMLNLDFSAWRKELEEQKVQHPLNFRTFEDAIPPQYAIQVLDELTNGNAIICTGVGHHQMWAAQFYKYNRPRQWLTSGGLGFMGFGLPASIGAAVARPDSVVVNIDDSESFVMNVQELATIRVENLPVKIMVLNNQHLSPVLREDCSSGAYGTYKYLGNPPKESEIFPNMLKFAEACEIPAARVMKKDDLGAAMQEMLGTPGPYLLDVIVPHQEHVLPVGYPSGGAAASIGDVITEGNGDQNVDKLKQHFGYKEKNKKLKMKRSPICSSVL